MHTYKHTYIHRRCRNIPAYYFSSILVAAIAEEDGANPGPAHSSGVSHEQLQSYHEQCLEEVARSINTFILADKYQLRQLWVELA